MNKAIAEKLDHFFVRYPSRRAFFPMAWVVNTLPNLYYFEAMDDVQVRIAPNDEVVAFVKRVPDVLFDLLQRLYIGLDVVLTRMEHLMSGNARGRLIIILVISAKRFGTEQADGIRIDLKLTYQDLASLAGLTRETVSREMMQLKKAWTCRLYEYFNYHLQHQDIGKRNVMTITKGISFRLL